MLRGAGLRLGELLDLDLNCLWDLSGHGTWLKVPLGKLATEWVVPLDDATMAALDGWMALRGRQRSLPHPRDGRPTDFLFTLRGARIFTKKLGARPSGHRSGGQGSAGKAARELRVPSRRTRRVPSVDGPAPGCADRPSAQGGRVGGRDELITFRESSALPPPER